MRIIKRQSALRDMQVIVDYIAQDNPKAAEQWIIILQRHLELLAEFPLQGIQFKTTRLELQNMRKAILPAYRNYMVFYLPLADGVEIVRVLHTSRNIQEMLDAR